MTDDKSVEAIVRLRLLTFLVITKEKEKKEIKQTWEFLTSIWKSFLSNHKSPLLLMIQNCNLSRSAKIYLVHLIEPKHKRERLNTMQ